MRVSRHPADHPGPAEAGSSLHARRDDVAGVSTFALEGGSSTSSRTPVVFVHGLALSSRYLRPSLIRLGATRRVFAPDLPGVGRSQSSKQPESMADLADGLAEWMRKVGLGRADIVGHSLGCQVVGEFAVRHPDLVRRVVLASPSRDPDHPGVWQSAWRLAVDAPRERLGIIPLAIVDYLRAGPIKMLRILASARREDLMPVLESLEQPTLILYGDRDPLVSRTWVSVYARTLRHGRSASIPGGPHGIPYSRGVDFARSVTTFLDESM